MGESGMTKYVIRTVELVKRVYLVDAYTKSEAYDKLIEMGPEGAVEVEVLGDHIFHEETINEYEYNKDWIELASGRKKLKDQGDWVGEIEPVEISEGQGSLVAPDKLKGPTLNEIW